MERALDWGSCGLCSKTGPVPLVGVDVRADIRDFAAGLVVSQRFRNDEMQAIEAVYKFPLDEGSAVCGFEILIDGRRIEGRVEAREVAFAEYDDAIADGHGAYLLEEERPDIFSVSVGALPPGAEAVVRVTTVAELSMEGDAIRVTIPTTISPRYAPAVDRQGVGESEAERVSPPFVSQVPYGLLLSAEIELSGGVRGVASPTDAIEVRLRDTGATVRLSARETVMDHDVVLLIDPARRHEPSVVVERTTDGELFAQLSLRPTFEADRVANEVIFLVDRSGSMHGTSIEEARNALQACLRSLRVGSRFNIVGFGDRFSPLFRESRLYDDTSLAEASRYVASMDADLGGTELLPALQWVLSQQVRSGMPRQLFVLTDGQVTNMDDVIELVRSHAPATRTFAFGIGAGSSSALVKGMARAGGGAAEFIAPGERIEAKVLRQLRRALAPALADVLVDWGGLSASQAPEDMPPVFADGRVQVFAKLDEAAATTVRLTGRTNDGPFEATATIDPATARDGRVLATLWARNRVRDLEASSDLGYARRGSRQARSTKRAERDPDQVRAEIVRLGTTYSLLTRETSFVAVETRDVRVNAGMELRKVPVAVTDGWHGFVRARLSKPGMAAGPSYFSLAAPSAVDVPTFARLVEDTDGFARWDDDPSHFLSSPIGYYDDVASEERALGHAARSLDRLIALQLADGAWPFTPELAVVVGATFEQLLLAWADRRAEQLLPEVTAGTDLELQLRAFATAVALRWLEKQWHEARDEWALLADKAAEWLDDTPEGGAFWRDAVEATAR